MIFTYKTHFFEWSKMNLIVYLLTTFFMPHLQNDCVTLTNWTNKKSCNCPANSAPESISEHKFWCNNYEFQRPVVIADWGVGASEIRSYRFNYWFVSASINSILEPLFLGCILLVLGWGMKINKTQHNTVQSILEINTVKADTWQRISCVATGWMNTLLLAFIANSTFCYIHFPVFFC